MFLECPHWISLVELFKSYGINYRNCYNYGFYILFEFPKEFCLPNIVDQTRLQKKMEKTEKQKEVEANEMAAENNIYCENDRVVRKYYQVRIK